MYLGTSDPTIHITICNNNNTTIMYYNNKRHNIIILYMVLVEVRKRYMPLGSLGSEHNMSTDCTRDHTMLLLPYRYYIIVTYTIDN
jgi:hypothetical protein